MGKTRLCLILFPKLFVLITGTIVITGCSIALPNWRPDARLGLYLVTFFEPSQYRRAVEGLRLRHSVFDGFPRLANLLYSLTSWAKGVLTDHDHTQL